jgi:hypothetical protein
MQAEASSAWWKALQKPHRMLFRVSRVDLPDKLQKRKPLALIGYFVSAFLTDQTILNYPPPSRLRRRVVTALRLGEPMFWKTRTTARFAASV